MPTSLNCLKGRLRVRLTYACSGNGVKFSLVPIRVWVLDQYGPLVLVLLLVLLLELVLVLVVVLLLPLTLLFFA